MNRIKFVWEALAPLLFWVLMAAAAACLAFEMSL